MRRAVIAGCLSGLLLLLAGCGQETGSAADPSSSVSSGGTGEGPGSGSGGASEVVLLDATAAGGTIGEPVPVGTPEQLADFTAQLTSAPFVREVRAAVATARAAAGEDEVVEAAVVAIGCDVPEAVTLGRDGELEVTGPGGVGGAKPPAAGTQRQCLAAVTTVAVLTVPG